MKYIKMFESFNKGYIESICKKYDITNYTINNGLVDVDGNVILPSGNLGELPIKFGKISGHFDCSNTGLGTLDGCPKYVGGYFDCSNNHLRSLKFCPKYVGEDFVCGENYLRSLIGSPEEVFGDFFCYSNNLTSLEGCPKRTNNFACNDNRLESLEFCPMEVNGNFGCERNKLTSLKFSPKKVYGTFDCTENILTSLDGLSESIGYGLYIGDNNIFSIKNIPNGVEEFFCESNPIENIYKLFNRDAQSFIDSLDYNYFRGGNKINKIRLTQALKEIDKECPGNIEGYIWE